MRWSFVAIGITLSSSAWTTSNSKNRFMATISISLGFSILEIGQVTFFWSTFNIRRFFFCIVNWSTGYSLISAIAFMLLSVFLASARTHSLHLFWIWFIHSVKREKCTLQLFKMELTSLIVRHFLCSLAFFCYNFNGSFFFLLIK